MMKLTRRSFLSASAAAAAHVLSRGAWAEKGPETGFDFVQICDTQMGMGGYEHDVETFRLAVRQINALNPRPEFVVICGDLVHTPGNEKQASDFKAIKAGLDMGCYCVPGNHEMGNKGDPELLKRYRETFGEDYYLKELPACVLVGLNTQLWMVPVGDEAEKQTGWLEKAMAKAPVSGKPIVVFGHQPLFLRDPQEKEEYYNLPVACRQQLLRLFKKHGVGAYLSGHSHKNLINAYEGIQLVTSATTSRNFDNAPMGFRVWHVRPPGPYRHEYVAIKGAQPPAQKK